MANGNRRIPRADHKFDRYIRITTAALLEGDSPVGWQRLQFSEEEKDQWKALHDEWVAIYARNADARLRSSVVVKQKNDVRKRFTKFTFPILILLQTKPFLTLDDRAVFNVPLRKTTVTKRSAIDHAPESKLENMEGGRLRLRVRVQGSEGRGRMHPMADHLDIRYAILPMEATPPKGAMDCQNHTVSTKALTVLELPDEARAKVVHLFCRWVNSSDNKKSGPWSFGIQAIVS